MLNKISKSATSLFSSILRHYKKSFNPYNEADIVYTSKLQFAPFPPTIPEFRVINLYGEVLAPEYDNIEKEILLKIFNTMIKLEEMENYLLKSQRQGRVSFYLTSTGEGAAIIASAAALRDDDFVFPQYREQGSLMWRGHSIQQFVDQTIGNIRDKGKAKQMPMHFGSSKLNYMTVSTPLATQLGQAAGAGYGFRLQGMDKIAVAYLGDGAASEGDFHAGLNFAATLKCQTLFLCRNNRYAISTPSTEQYSGDGIAGRGPAYRIATLRVDGNDALAVYNAVKYSREHIVKEKKPALVEMMTYRVGDHSTSDDSTLYREKEEIESWKTQNNPIKRLGLYLKKKGYIISDTYEEETRNVYREEVLTALKDGMQVKLAPSEELFDDVYDKLTTNLLEQKEELMEHLKVYGEKYKVKH